MTTMPINQVKEERPFLILWPGFVPYIGQGKDDDVGGWMDGSDVEKKSRSRNQESTNQQNFQYSLKM